jgi:hypothetical protein
MTVAGSLLNSFTKTAIAGYAGSVALSTAGGALWGANNAVNAGRREMNRTKDKSLQDVAVGAATAGMLLIPAVAYGGLVGFMASATAPVTLPIMAIKYVWETNQER